MLCTEIVSDIQNNFCTQHVLPTLCKKKSFWQRFTCNVTSSNFWVFLSIRTRLKKCCHDELKSEIFCQIEHWTFCSFKSSSIRGHSCHKNSVVGCFSLNTGLANSTITLRLHVGIFGLVGVILCRNLLSNKDVSPESKLQLLNICKLPNFQMILIENKNQCLQ